MWLWECVFLLVSFNVPYQGQAQRRATIRYGWLDEQKEEIKQQASKRYNWLVITQQKQLQIDQLVNNWQIIKQIIIKDSRTNSHDQSFAQTTTNQPDYAQRHSQISNEMSESDKTNPYRRKSKQVRSYVSKRIYLCGECLRTYGFVQQLVIHIKKAHKGVIPDGTIYGIKKEALFKYFNIFTTKPTINPNRRVYIFRCGCGREYNCSSSLYYHIKTIHNGSQPIGTIGGVPISPI